MQKTIRYFFLLVFFSLIFAKRAHAYLDPGSGSYLIQILIASLAGGGFLLKSQWKMIKEKIFKNKEKKGKNDDK